MGSLSLLIFINDRKISFEYCFTLWILLAALNGYATCDGSLCDASNTRPLNEVH